VLDFNKKKSVLVLHVCSFGFPLLICLSSVFYLGARVLQPPPAIFFRDFPPTGSPVQASLLFYFPLPPFSCWGLHSRTSLQRLELASEFDSCSSCHRLIWFYVGLIFFCVPISS
jgi:hypothetical protein